MKHDHCVACGQSENLNHHHLVPRSIGGSDDDSNLITLCGSCHAKAHQVKADWRHSELTSKALQAKKARNERVGTIPFGYRCSNKTLIEDKSEQTTIDVIHNLSCNGLSLRKIVIELGKKGFVSRSGQPFQLTQVQRIVNKELMQ